MVDKGKLLAKLTAIDDDIEEITNLLQEVDAELNDSRAHVYIEKMKVTLEMLSEYHFSLAVALGNVDDDHPAGDKGE